MKNLTKLEYANIIKDMITISGGKILETYSLSHFKCTFNNSKLDIFIRYRCYPENESKLSHFENQAFNNLIAKSDKDETTCLAVLGHYSYLGREQIISFLIPIKKILQLENASSSIFSIGEKTSRHIIKMPSKLYEEAELINEALCFQKNVIIDEI